MSSVRLLDTINRKYLEDYSKAAIIQRLVPNNYKFLRKSFTGNAHVPCAEALLAGRAIGNEASNHFHLTVSIAWHALKIARFVCQKKSNDTY